MKRIRRISGIAAWTARHGALRANVISGGTTPLAGIAGIADIWPRTTAVYATEVYATDKWLAAVGTA